MKKHLILIVSMIALAGLHAQTNGHPDKAKLKEYRENPHWIHMMKDPNVNYYEAVAAFDEFWRGKPNPIALMEGEEEEMEEHGYGERSFLSKLFKSDEKVEKEALKYAMDYKSFRFWQVQSEGFVKPDGTVMSQEEVQSLVEQELQNRQNSAK